MAFCGKCGSELLEGTKLCTNCGTAALEKNISQSQMNSSPEKSNDDMAGETIFRQTQGDLQDNTSVQENHNQQSIKRPLNYESRQKSVTSVTPQNYKNVEVVGGNIDKIDKFGKLYGIILLILAIVDFQTDPAFVTIILSIAIIAGCVFCFSRKYKLKIFTIIALILAVICLLAGISQAKSYGLFKIPGKSSSVTHKNAEYDNKSVTEDDLLDINKNRNDTVDEIAGSNVKTSETTVEKSTEDSKESAFNSEESDDPIADSKAQNSDGKGEDIDEFATTEDVADSEEKTVEKVTEETSTEKAKADGIDPDFKAFLDSYEAFMDEYVDFMKKYQEDPGNSIKMLVEYTDVMKRYAEFAEAIDKYDTDEMTKEEAKYYLDVLNRCNQKMLDVY